MNVGNTQYPLSVQVFPLHCSPCYYDCFCFFSFNFFFPVIVFCLLFFVLTFLPFFFFLYISYFHYKLTFFFPTLLRHCLNLIHIVIYSTLLILLPLSLHIISLTLVPPSFARILLFHVYITRKMVLSFTPQRK